MPFANPSQYLPGPGEITGTMLAADSIDGKTITGALFRSAATGKRWEIDSVNFPIQLRAYSGSVNEQGPALIQLNFDNSLVLTSPQPVGKFSSSIFLNAPAPLGSGVGTINILPAPGASTTVGGGIILLACDIQSTPGTGGGVQIQPNNGGVTALGAFRALQIVGNTPGMIFQDLNHFTDLGNATVSGDYIAGSVPGDLCVKYSGAGNHFRVINGEISNQAGWFRSFTSGTGWYSEPNTIGIYAIDSSWIRTYPSSVPGIACGSVSSSGTVSAVGLQANGGRLIFTGSNDAIIHNNTNRALFWFAGDARITESTNSVFTPIRASAFTVSSSIDVKQNIAPTRFEGIKSLLNITISDYNYTEGVWESEKNKLFTGIMAGDLALVYPPAVSFNIETGKPDGIDYGQLTPLIIKGFQELVAEARSQIKDLRSRVATLEKGAPA